MASICVGCGDRKRQPVTGSDSGASSPSSSVAQVKDVAVAVVDAASPVADVMAGDLRPGDVTQGLSADALVADQAVADGVSSGPDVFDPEEDRRDAGAEVAREAKDPAAVQCNAILDRAWAMMKPALRRLKVRASARVRDDYRGMRTRDSSWTADESRGFLARCRRLSKSKRDCIAKAAHPVLGIYTCKVLHSGPRALRPYPPTVYQHVKLVRPPVVPKADRAAALAALAGTWVNDDEASGVERRWVLGEDGKGRESIVYDGGKTKRRKFRLRVKRALRLVRKDGRAPWALLTFYKEKPGTFYASEAGYGVFAVADPKKFVVDHFGEFVFWEGPADGVERDCDVVSATGLMVRGRCSNSDTAFQATWEFAEQRKRDGALRRVTSRWRWTGGHLLDERLVQRGRFLRK